VKDNTMIKESLQRALDGEPLSEQAAYDVMDFIMSGEATDAQIAGWLVALRFKGETVEEITGFARAMRDKATRVASSRQPLVDTCGTGGDALHTFNISTAAAFVACGAGAAIAKHGNRAVSSKCGSADVLGALGVNLELTPEQVGKCLDEVGIGFLYAPLLHPAMKHAIGPRREMGVRTVFNILGPLTNPAGARCQALGVFSTDLVEPLANVLARLGTERAFVCSGVDGLDELSTLGETVVSEVRAGAVTTTTVTPEDFGLKRAARCQLSGGTPDENAQLLREILGGAAGPRTDIVKLNAAAAIASAGLADSLADGLPLAAESLNSGRGLEKLTQLIELSNSLA